MRGTLRGSWDMNQYSMIPCLDYNGRTPMPAEGIRQMPSTDASPVLLLSGADWRGFEESAGTGAERGLFDVPLSSPEAIPATVPGNVQSDLEAAHLLNPLWYGAGDPRLHEAARKDWWYRKDFPVPVGFAGRRLTLVFDGVDHDCAVWINGHSLGRHAGMFRRFWFDASAYLRAGEVNRVAVRIARMPDDIAPLVVQTDGSGVGSPFVEGIARTRVTLKDLKSPTNWGWDWGTNLWTLGIWKDVRLEAGGPARIDWVRVQSALRDDHAAATITAALEIDSASALPARMVFRISGHGSAATASVERVLVPGPNTVEARLPLDHPALWWPNGHGNQALYTLQAEVLPVAGGPASDARTTRFGVRDIRWIHTEGAPADHVNRFQLVLNGRPIRTMGSNLIPPDLLFGRMGPRSRLLLQRAKAAGMNALRLWGGGVILHDDAYDLADELGIMLLQELPLANSWPETDAVFLRNLEATARNIFRQLRNHPAIIELDGGNEMPWNSTTQHPALQLLQQIAAEEDGRLFRATCPDLGATHGPWYFDIREACRLFDERATMRAGEFGAASPANLEVWQRDIPPQSRWPADRADDPVQVHKNIVRAVFDEDYWLRKRYLDDLFGPLGSLHDLVEAGQWHGAEGLRYEVDAMRRNGRRTGGLTTWDYNEPWPNGAGSVLVDYDGRTLMSYDFIRQALAPLSLSLRYASPFYDPRTGFRAQLYLTSDAPEPAADLRWSWLARDRRGRIFAHGGGTAGIEPLEVKPLGEVLLRPPTRTCFGPLFVETRIENPAGNLLAERLYLLGLEGVVGPLAGLLDNRGDDLDDDPSELPAKTERPDGPGNLAYIGNGAQPATTSSRDGRPGQARAINDGAYGSESSWTGDAPRSWFQIDLGKTAEIGRFKLGRDRTGGMPDRPADYLKIESSLDGQAWETVLEKDRITNLPGFSPARTLTAQTAPRRARFVKVTVDSQDSARGGYACVDEFEVYAPSPKPPAGLPSVAFAPERTQLLWRPVRRTSLEVTALSVRTEASQETLTMRVENSGRMTAFFCEPHPLIDYRTDLFIDNNHCFVPPGESRTITIRMARRHEARDGELSLAQIGWRITAWNADDLLIEPLDVLLAVGRRDRMCREFLDETGSRTGRAVRETTLTGNRPDPAGLPCLLGSADLARFEFELTGAQARLPVRLWIHTADQSKDPEATVVVKVNAALFKQSLPKGLGVQQGNPSHLAFPASLSFALPSNVLQAGWNIVEVAVVNEGWFTWDALIVAGIR
jgi:beta-mannosidase